MKQSHSPAAYVHPWLDLQYHSPVFTVDFSEFKVDFSKFKIDFKLRKIYFNVDLSKFKDH